MHAPSKILMSAVLALIVGAFSAREAAAQEPVSIPSAEAEQFMGEWNLPLQGEQPFTIQLNIRDDAGQVAAEVGAQGANSPVTNISKADGKLVLQYTLDLGGQEAPISISLAPEGTNLAAVLDIAGGMYTVNGTATRK